MNKRLPLFLLTLIFTFPSFSQVYKCGVTVDNYVKEQQAKTIKSVCSDKNGNIYYFKSNGIYKNNVSWILYKPNTYTSYFSFPQFLATDQTNLYAYDGNAHIIFKITPTGEVTELAGIRNMNSSINGPNATATFGYVTALTADKMGNVYVGENTKIRKIGIDGNVTTVVGKDVSGRNNGDVSVATFEYIESLTTDHKGNLFVIDFSQYIRKVDAAGTVSNYVGGNISSYVDDVNYQAGFDNLTCIYYGNDGYLYVGVNNAIRRISPTGETITLVGGVVNATNSYNLVYSNNNKDQVSPATAITLAPNGKLYFYATYTYYDYSIIRRVSVDNACEQEKRIVETICGNGYQNAQVYGNGKNSEMELPRALTIDKSKNLYFSVSNYSSVYKMTPARDVSLFYTPSNYENGPRSLVTDANGMLYISYGNSIEVVSSNGIHIKTFNSNVNEPFSVERMVIDSNGDLLFTDVLYDNIRKLNTTTGSYSTIAGGINYGSYAMNQGYVDGTSANARFYNPYGIDVDSKGNIYIVDQYYSYIRKISTTGTVSTVFGGVNTGKFDGYVYLCALQVDHQDNIYVSDESMNVIRKINVTNSTTQIVAGNTIENKSEYIDGKSSIASFADPIDIYFDTDKNLWVADMSNSCIRRITGLDGPLTTAVAMPVQHTETKNYISYPNPTSNILHFDEERSFEIYDMNGVSKVSGKNNSVDISTFTDGLYLIRFEEINVTEKIIKD